MLVGKFVRIHSNDSFINYYLLNLPYLKVCYATVCRLRRETCGGEGDTDWRGSTLPQPSAIFETDSNSFLVQASVTSLAVLNTLLC